MNCVWVVRKIQFPKKNTQKETDNKLNCSTVHSFLKCFQNRGNVLLFANDEEGSSYFCFRDSQHVHHIFNTIHRIR